MFSYPMDIYMISLILLDYHYKNNYLIEKMKKIFFFK